MNVIVVGAGEVGFHIAARLSREAHDVTVVERDADRVRLLRERLNAAVIEGSGGNPEVLDRAGAQTADLFIAVTSLDEVNLTACLLASESGAKRTIARLTSLETDIGRLRLQRLGIDLLINPEHVVAAEIRRVVAHESATEVAEFAGGRVVFLGYRVPPASPLAGTSLRDVGAISGMYRLVVTAVSHDGTTIIPRGDDVIAEGDIVYFACAREDLPAIRYLFGFDRRRERSVFVLGGGRVGAALAGDLAADGYRVTVVERSLPRCEHLARTIEDVRVLHADGTDVEALADEGMASADVFVAVTDDDRTNILCALLARRQGAGRVVALVNHPQFVALAPSLGVDACISPRLATAAAILKHVRRGGVQALAMVEQADAEVIEMELAEDSAVIGVPLTDLPVPDGSIIAVILRDDGVIIPTGEDRLQAGDHLIVFSLPDAVALVERFFSRS